MRHYATLFDANYLPQGLALLESLKQHSAEPFELHILAMDLGLDLALTLSNLGIGNFITLGALEEYYPRLEDLRLSRSWQEHCWTMASVYSDWLLESCGDEEVTYLDADLFFFSNPSPIFAQIGKRSIAITPHRLPDNSQKARLEANGKYNVGFVHFKNTEAGANCLSRWATKVRERCSAKYGCGDQVYLDSWETDYPGEVAILGHGINTGPWNLSAYEVTQYDGQVFLGRDPLYCYHFHEWAMREDGSIRRTNYPLRQRDIDLIYDPYATAIKQAKKQLEAVHLQTR